MKTAHELSVLGEVGTAEDDSKLVEDFTSGVRVLHDDSKAKGQSRLIAFLPPAITFAAFIGVWYLYSATKYEIAAQRINTLPFPHEIISDGFLGMPEKTLEAWRDLWFHTGDAMRRDADGWYFFVDRLKDTLRRRGENISSFEVENTVREHPLVAECAVVGVPADEQGGEDEVMVFVVLNPGAALDPAEMIEFCRPRMPKFALPRFVQVVSSLPQTPSGKVQKAKLREHGVRADTWDATPPQRHRQG
jgi:acyl-CoA synthetase (AMP-forming)/AMP-acid ligase II